MKKAKEWHGQNIVVTAILQRSSVVQTKLGTIMTLFKMLDDRLNIVKLLAL